MATRVRVITEAVAVAVLSYPREIDPVFGAEFTEVAKLPPHTEQEFTLSPGCDLLVVEWPIGDGAGENIVPVTLPSEAESEAA